MKCPWFRALVWSAALLVQGRVQADFFVSPSGDDANPGTRAQPFATPEAARDAVRRQRVRTDQARQPLTIWLRGGDYPRNQALELTAADSGTPAAPIVWRAAPGESPRWLGGRRLPELTAWTPITEAAVLQRLDPEARGPVRQLDLRALGLTNFGRLQSRGFSRPAVPAHSELFHQGRPMTLARWPNTGDFTHLAGFPEAAGKGDDHGGQIGELPGGFLYSGDRPRRWAPSTNIWVHGYWAWDWANSYEQVASLDLTTRLLKTAPPHGLYGFRKGQRFYFLNVMEELDQPGEWFLDSGRGMLYFWPPNPTASTGPAETILSTLDQPLLRLTDVSHVTVRGLILEATRATAVEIRGGTSNRIAGCVLRNLGNGGVTIEGGTGHGVSGCDVFDTGDGGVSLTGGNRQDLTPGGHFAENCHFQRQARWSKCYVPAVLIAGVGQRASHNLIHDHPHSAILFTGNDHLLEFNDIHHIALETGDVGAIYTGRDYSYRGNRIRYNYIHETGGVGMGSMGVYMDDCVSGTEIFGNIFYQVHWAMFIGGGRDHRVENNIFVECDPAVRMDGRGLDRTPVWRDMVNDYMRKQLAAVPPALYRERYPALKSLDKYYGPPAGPMVDGTGFTGIPPEGNAILRNICVGKWTELGWNARTEWVESRDNLVGTNPGFVDAEHRNFRLQPDSAAWKLGFQKIPVEQIGLQPDEWRAELPTTKATPAK